MARAAGIEVPVLTGGGTGTYNIDPEVEGMTDVQVGWVLTSFNACIDITTAFEDALAEDLGDEAAACLTDTLGEVTIEG